MGLFDWNFDGNIDIEDEVLEYELLFGDDMELETDEDSDFDDF